MDNMGQKMPLKISQDIAECNNAWMIYLQELAGLCSAGARVSQSLQALAHGMPAGTTASNCRTAWEELLRATQAATLSVGTEVTAGLRELAEDPNSRSTEQIVSSSLTSLVNLQYQFCVACCECLGQITTPDSINQQLQNQQVSPSSMEAASYRQHQLFSRLLGGQRRWSEVAARRTTERDEDDDGAPRRWSVPWEGPGAGGVPAAQHQLAVPLTTHERSSRSTTPDSASLASQEELQEVISLLSCRPATQLHPSNKQVPGVILTNCSQTDGRETWPPVPLFPRDGNPSGGVSWYQGHAEGVIHSDTGTPQHRRGGSPRPAHHSRARTGWTPHEPHFTTIWGEQEGEQSVGNLELFTNNHQESNNCQPYHRKSSSSTDSSSSSSLQQHTNTNTTPEQQRPGNLYSMWSGSEMASALPFIQLPSSPNNQSEPPGTLLP